MGRDKTLGTVPKSEVGWEQGSWPDYPAQRNSPVREQGPALHTCPKSMPGSRPPQAADKQKQGRVVVNEDGVANQGVKCTEASRKL